jgi:hypothetical protein
VVAGGANVMLCLPEPPTLDARTRVERVDDAPPEEVPRGGRRGNEQQSARRRRNLGLARGCLAKEKPESWTGGTKQRRRRHRQVQLKRAWQQEYAVDGRGPLEIGEPDGAEFIDERPRPIFENLNDGDVVGDAEGEVQIREAIAVVDSQRTHGGSGYDAVILLREPQRALAEGIPLFDGKHLRHL